MSAPQPYSLESSNPFVFQELFDDAPVAYHEMSVRGILTRVNHAECLLLGYSPAYMTGKPALDFIAPKDRVRFASLLATVEQRRELPSTEQFDFLAYDGNSLPFEVHQRYMYDESGAASGVRAALVDLSTRMQAIRALEASEEQYRLIVETTLDWVWSVDINRRFVFSNRSVEKILGYSVDEIVGSDWLTYVDESDRPRILRHAEQAAANASSWTGLQVRLRHKDGSVRLLESNGVPITDGLRVVGFRGSDRDVTERRRAEELILERDRAQEANRLKTELLSRVSHEFRTPLNAILGFAQLLQLMPELTGKGHQHVEHILKSGAHLLELINEVLEYSRVEAETLQPVCAPVDLWPCVREAAAGLAGLPQFETIRLEILDQPECLVLADDQRLRQILTNLLTNAVMFNRPHGAILVYSTPEHSGLFTRIHVVDSGVGIAAHELPRIFEPRQHVPPVSHANGGMGLGLAIAKAFVEVMGGRIGVESAIDQGSHFWFDLPTGRRAAEIALV